MQIMKPSSLKAPASSRATGGTAVVGSRLAVPHRSSIRTHAKASSNDEASQIAFGRRQLFLGSAGLVIASPTLVAHADAEDAPYATFLGYATPPTSYGGYGGNAVEAAKYQFEYPESWKQEQPSKSEKGTKGIDGRVVNPRIKGQRAFVITLGRAGEDNKSFRLADLDQTFQGFAGADYDLQDALVSATEITKTEKEIAGNQFFEFDIDSPEVRYLASITVKEGKVFALFVKTPAKNFKREEGKLRHIIETFKLL